MFCKYCGKEVPDGQVCSCQTGAVPVAPAAPQQAPQQPYAQQPYAQQPYAQQPYAQQPYAQQPYAQQPYGQPYQQPAPTNGFGKVVGDAFKGMPAALKRLLSNTFGAGSDMPSSVIFSVGSLILHVLAWVCLVGGLIGSLKEMAVGMSGGFMDAAAMTMVEQQIKMMFKGVYGMAIWAGVLSYIVPLAIAVLIPVVGQLIRKEKVDWAHNFIVAAHSQVLPAVLFILGALLAYLSFGLGMIFVLIGIMTSIIATFKLLAKQMKSTNTLLGSLVAAVVVLVCIALVTWIVSGAVTGYVEKTLLANMGMLGADLSDLSDLLDMFG